MRGSPDSFFPVCGMQAAAVQAPAAPGPHPRPPLTISGTLVGPIALYPDDLVAIILPAATNPLQLVQADRFLDKRKADPKLAVDDKWDDAVKSLLNYPDVVKMMSGDLDWMSALGEAVVADQGEVLEAIQSFRRKAQAAGNLKSDDKQVVVVEKEVITVVPADPQVIYVPQYNPTTVVTYGVAPYWGYYPTPYPSCSLPVPLGRRGGGRDLGCRHRRGVERQPLRLRRWRHHRQQKHRNQPWRKHRQSGRRPPGRG
ncbi:MAG: DUF3300 domain-containing protein [Betaproteobacteria bacterium]|nr:DUF3300 domain-containing protein [Betaproteobacteria bacterium]